MKDDPIKSRTLSKAGRKNFDSINWGKKGKRIPFSFGFKLSFPKKSIKG